MTTYQMKWPKKYTESGFIREILGVGAKKQKLMFSNYLPPIEGKIAAGDIGKATFELEEGKMYYLRETGESYKKYIKVEKQAVIEIEREEVIDHFVPRNNNATKTHPLNSSLGGVIQKELKIEYLISNIEIAFKLKIEQASEDAYQGALIPIWNFAKDFQVEEEYKEISKAFHEGKTIEQVREMVTPKPKPINPPRKEGFLSMFNVPAIT